MAQLILVAFAGFLGWAAYREAEKFEKVRRRGPGGMSPRLCCLTGILAGVIAACFAAPFLVAAFAGYSGYLGAATFERLNRDRLFGLAAMLYGIAGFFIGLFGALFRGAAEWGVVCALVVLVGALLLMSDENNALREENERLSAGPQPGPPGPPQRQPEPQQAQPSADPVPARKTYLFGPPEAPRTQGAASRWSQPAAGPDRTDHLLPNRAEARSRPGDANDLLPDRR